MYHAVPNAGFYLTRRLSWCTKLVESADYDCHSYQL